METSRSREVEIGFIDGSHFHHRRKSGENRSHAVAPLRVEIVATVQENSVRAKLSCGAQRHGRMNAIAARFVARCRDDSAAIRLPTHNDGLATQLGTFEQFHRNKKCIHVHVQNRSRVQPEHRGFALGTEMGEPRHEPCRSFSHQIASGRN